MNLKHKYTDQNLTDLVAINTCWADVCRALGIPPATGSQTHLTKRAKSIGLDTSHFRGKAWNRGREFPAKRKSLSIYLVRNSTIKSDTLKKRLIRDGIKEAKCEICKLTEWNGKSIPVELDHKNSDHWDNRLENLQIICPNCHAQETRERISARGEIGETHQT